MEVSNVGIAIFGDPKTDNFSLRKWGWRKKFPRRRFGDGGEILSSPSKDFVVKYFIEITFACVYLSILYVIFILYFHTICA
jgi:hypothetical protein